MQAEPKLGKDGKLITERTTPAPVRPEQKEPEKK